MKRQYPARNTDGYVSTPRINAVSAYEHHDSPEHYQQYGVQPPINNLYMQYQGHVVD